MDNHEKKYHEMTESPVEKLVVRMAIPTIISMLVTTFYNMADSFFVGKINTSAVGAVGICFSYMTVIQAVGFFFGHGSGNYISFMLGKQKHEEAEVMASVGFFSSLACGFLIMIVGLIGLRPLAIFLGSTKTILPYTMQYLGLILIGTPYMTSSLVLNNHLRFQGNALYAMIGITSGAFLNVILDPIFIFVFKLGVRGAALATILSQLAGFTILWYQSTRGDNIRLRFSNFKPSVFYAKEILRGGLPSLTRQALTGLSTVALNRYAGLYGDAAIAAMSIVQRISNFATAALIGFGQGFQPVCGFNYGSAKYDRVRKAFWFCIKISATCLCVIAVGLFVFAPQLVGLFRDDAQVVGIGSFALRMQALTLPMSSFIVISNMMMQNIGKVFKASLLAAARQGLFLIIVLIIIVPQLGILGIQIAQPIADFCALTTAVILQRLELKELQQLEQGCVTG